MGAPWQRADGFDPRDPSAPAVFQCLSCDTTRDEPTAFCASCEEVTGSYFGAGNPARATLDGEQITQREAECHREIARRAA